VTEYVAKSGNLITGKRERKVNSGDCYRCGEKNHRASECRFKKDKCYVCGKIGQNRPGPVATKINRAVTL